MKSRFFLLIILPLASLTLPNLFVSCATNDPGNKRLEQKLYQQNSDQANSIERRSMRRGARDQRYDAWFDMLMQ